MECDTNNISFLNNLLYLINTATNKCDVVNELIRKRCLSFSKLTVYADDNCARNTLIVEILKHFIENDVYYEEDERVISTFDYINIIIVYYAKNNKKILPNLLELLHKLLSRVGHYLHLPVTFQLVTNLNKIAENEQICVVYSMLSAIAQQLISHKKLKYTKNLSNLIRTITLKLNENRNINEIMALLHCVLKYGRHLCLDELIIKLLPVYYFDANDEVELSAVLMCIEMGLKIFDCNSKSIFLNELMKETTKLYHSMCSEITRKHAKEILHEAILYFCNINKVPWLQSYGSLDELLNALPMDVNKWFTTENDVVIIIMHIVHVNSGMHLHWKDEKEILMLVTNRLIKSTQTLPIFKASFYIYTLYRNTMDSQANSTDEILVSYLEQTNDLKQILTYEYFQLNWLLKYSSDGLKLKVLIFWVEMKPFSPELIEAAIIHRFTDGNMWLHFFSKIEFSVSKQFAIALSKTNDKQVSETFSKNITKSVSESNLFHILLMLNLENLPDDSECMNLCNNLAAKLSTFDDTDVIIAGITFIKRILCEKKSLDLIKSFCTRLNNIELLLAHKNNDVSIEVAALMNKLLKMQNKNGIEFNKTFTISSAPQVLLRNTHTHLILLHTLLYCRHKRKKMLFKVNDDDAEALFNKLHEYFLSKNVKVVCKCLIRLFYENDTLAYSIVPRVFIEMASNNDNFHHGDILNCLILYIIHYLKQIKFDDFIKYVPLLEINKILLFVPDGNQIKKQIILTIGKLQNDPF